MNEIEKCPICYGELQEFIHYIYDRDDESEGVLYEFECLECHFTFHEITSNSIRKFAHSFIEQNT